MQSTELHCEQCNASFQRREHFERHTRTHTQEKPFTCSDCGQRFGRIDSLSRHYSTIHRLDPPQQSKKRRRVAQACRPCNMSKLRCDGRQPCERCQNNGIDCFYSAPEKRHQNDQSTIIESPPSQKQRTDLSERADSGELESIHSLDLQGRFAAAPMPRSVLESQFGQELINADMSLMMRTMPDASQDLVDRAELTPASAPIMDRSQPDIPFMADGDGLVDWDLGMGLNLGTDVWSDLLESRPPMDRFDDIWLTTMEPKPAAADSIGAQVTQAPTPLTPAAVAEVYRQGSSPAFGEDEDMEPRQYKPTSIDIDAQLSFPDMQPASHLVDQEDFAHVREVGPNVVDEVTKLATIMDTSPSFPRFRELRVPPTAVINAWVQLYFEHFHPVFPFLHKSSFGGPGTHWLLVFTVSAIGAQFSRLPHAQTCARAMHEMIRRQSSCLCESQNKYGRELWITQVILLNHLGMRYLGERRALEIAEIYQALPVTLARRQQLLSNTMSLHKISRLDHSLDQKWQLWILDEERRRTGFSVWLVDSAFQSHFDLTPLMSLREMKISLPQSDDRWSASSAQRWASFPLPPGSQPPRTLEDLATDGSWMAAWKTTGVLGKQAIVQLLTNIVMSDHGRGSATYANIDRNHCKEVLKALLSTTEQEEFNPSVPELKARGLHQLSILSALMMCHIPPLPLLSSALQFKCRRSSGKELENLKESWISEPQARRLAVVYAARVFGSIRNQQCTHFSTPVFLLRATLVLWIFDVVCTLQQTQDSPSTQSGSPVVILGTPDTNTVDQTQWVESGTGRIKLLGIGNIAPSPLGRRRLLEESSTLMRSLGAWGIIRIYGQLLTRLQAE